VVSLWWETVSEQSVVSYISLGAFVAMMMMMTKMDIETSVYYVHLTWLIAREDYIKSVVRL
jgi:hypothetical protein